MNSEECWRRFSPLAARPGHVVVAEAWRTNTVSGGVAFLIAYPVVGVRVISATLATYTQLSAGKHF